MYLGNQFETVVYYLLIKEMISFWHWYEFPIVISALVCMTIHKTRPMMSHEIQLLGGHDFIGILDLNNGNNTNFSKKMIFRVKVLTFRFGCFQTLNSKSWRWPRSCWKSHKPMIFHPMTQPCSWHTFGGKEKRMEAKALFLSRWWKTKAMKTLTPRGYL